MDIESMMKQFEGKDPIDILKEVRSNLDATIRKIGELNEKNNSGNPSTSQQRGDKEKEPTKDSK